MLWDHEKSKEACARLWIDLGEPVDRNRNLFDFYLCTSDEPFGIGVSEGRKKDALRIIERPGKDDSEIGLGESFPPKAKIPVPFAEFVRSVECASDWTSVMSILQHDNYLNLSDPARRYVMEHLTIPPRQDITEVIQTIQEVIWNEGYLIPAILFRNRKEKVTSDQLGKLFERININGVTPPQAELFFSALKLKWPEVGDYVAEFNQDQNLRGLLQPTQIIFATLRLVRPQLVDLSLENFNRMTNEDRQAMYDLLKQEGGKPSTFQRCFRLAYQALLYQGGNDYGLPRLLLFRLRQRVWHTILYWIKNHLDKIGDNLSETDRLNMVRFALLDAMDYFLFRFPRLRGYSTYTNNTLFYKVLFDAVSDSNYFPIQKIYQQVTEKMVNDGWTNGEQTITIFTPEEYREWITPENTNESLNWNSFYIGDVCLMYAQRKYLQKWEGLQDLDKDHIFPYYWMNFTGPKGNNCYWHVDTVNADGRSPVINSPGNFRYWPAVLNREYQDKKPSYKYIDENTDQQLDENHQSRYLQSVSNILEASCIDADQVQLIKSIEALKGNEDLRIWTTDQYLAFKKLVDDRCFKMYKLVFNTLKFGDIEKSLENSQDNPVIG